MRRLLDVAGKMFGRRLTPEGMFAAQCFNQWFGRSVVVDDECRPIMLYHGTTKDFDQFTTSPHELGIHFGSLLQASSDRFLQAGQTGARVIPVYLSVINPLRLTDCFGRHADSLPDITSQLVEYDLMSEKDEDKLFELMSNSTEPDSIVIANAYREIERLIKEAGFDGVVYQNACEGDITDYPDSIRKSDLMRAQNDSWIVFCPSQIKSATGNSGRFTPGSASLTDTCALGAPHEAQAASPARERMRA